MEGNNEEVSALRQELVQMEKMSSMGMLSAGIAHEIKNPLNFILNFSKVSKIALKDMEEVLEDVYSKLEEDDREEIEELKENLKQNLGKIEENAIRIEDIIRNILLYSRGKSDEDIPTNVPKLVHDYLMLSYHAMRASDTNFNTSFDEHYPEEKILIGVVNPLISRVLINLFNNAFYALKQKTNLSPSGYSPVIKLVVEYGEKDYKIIVEDNGTGISEEVKQHLFKDVFTTKPAGEGTGLGMSIVHNIIVEKLKGSIDLESKEGEFTRFTITLPLKKMN
ncbi:MAG TPA: two-component sensor histidine kinase [Porphyromonadaceae bacterium]|nr:two-component sensor histidine kinase [Porphyromonadaceae bacterium]